MALPPIHCHIRFEDTADAILEASLDERYMTSINTSDYATFVDLPADIQEKIFDQDWLRANTLTITSSRHGKKRKTVRGARTWGEEMKVMRGLLTISPALRNSIIAMIASRTTIYTYGNKLDEVISSIPTIFLARVQHLHLCTTCPVSLDNTFMLSPGLRTVELGIELLTCCNSAYQLKTFGSIYGLTKMEQMVKLDGMVIEEMRSKLKHSENVCVRRALNDPDGKFKLLVKASFSFLIHRPDEEYPMTWKRSVSGVSLSYLQVDLQISDSLQALIDVGGEIVRGAKYCGLEEQEENFWV